MPDVNSCKNFIPFSIEIPVLTPLLKVLESIIPAFESRFSGADSLVLECGTGKPGLLLRSNAIKVYYEYLNFQGLVIYLDCFKAL